MATIPIVARLDDHTFVVDITVHTLARDFKKQISDMEGLQPDILDLEFEGNTITDSTVLSEMVTANAELTMGLSRRGLALKAIGKQNPSEFDFYDDLSNSNLVTEYVIVGFEVNKLFSHSGGTPLHACVKLGYKSSLETVLAIEGVDPNIQDAPSSSTPLALACADGDGVAVSLLLSHCDIDLNIPDRYGSTPLLIATKNGFSNIVSSLLSTNTVDVNHSDLTGFSSLMYACIYGDVVITTKLLAHPTIDVNRCNAYGRTSLFNSCVEGQEYITELLLNSPGINLDITDFHGQSLLHAVCKEGHAHILSLLLPALEATRPPSQLNSLLEMLEAADDHFFLKCLKETTATDRPQAEPAKAELWSDSRTPILLLSPADEHIHLRYLMNVDTVAAGEEEEEEELIYSDKEGSSSYSDCGVDTESSSSVGVRGCSEEETLTINSVDMCGITPLHVACSEGHVSVVSLLLSHPGIDVNKSNPLFTLLK